MSSSHRSTRGGNVVSPVSVMHTHMGDTECALPAFWRALQCALRHPHLRMQFRRRPRLIWRIERVRTLKNILIKGCSKQSDNESDSGDIFRVE